jgi:hypothetical protein
MNSSWPNHAVFDPTYELARDDDSCGVPGAGSQVRYFIPCELADPGVQTCAHPIPPPLGNQATECVFDVSAQRTKQTSRYRHLWLLRCKRLQRLAIHAHPPHRLHAAGTGTAGGTAPSRAADVCAVPRRAWVR